MRVRPLLFSTLLLLPACPQVPGATDAGEGPDVPVEIPDVPRGIDVVLPDVPPEDAGRCSVICGLSSCCREGEDCVAERCLPACDGARCGADDSVCCTGGTLCVGGACMPPGGPCALDRDCGAGETCEPLIGRCLPVPTGTPGECSYRPPVGVFSPEVQWEWTDGNVMVTPVIVQTNDDDGDGRVGVSDVPDVVVVAYEAYDLPGYVVALSGDDGHELWRYTEFSACKYTSPAAADIDADGSVEVLFMTDCGSMGESTARLAALSATGALEWRSDATTVAYYDAIAVGDLDDAPDHHAEIVAGQGVFDASGALLWSSRELGLGYFHAPVITDLDGDGRREVIAGGRAFRHDGTTFWTSGAPSGTLAVANFLPDVPGPQVVGVSGTSFTIVNGLTGATLLGPIAFEMPSSPFFMLRSGPPTVADFDGDGDREIGVAGDDRFVVLDPSSTAADRVLWSRPSEDLTVGSVGSTVFDFDADGRAEVVYADECVLRILDGRTGEELWWTPNTSGTLLEYPVIADVDNDGNAELIAPANAPPTLRCDGTRRTHPHTEHVSGIRVFRDRLDHWVPTRTVWNEHTYHVGNVEEDGSLPVAETPSWETHDTFRLNVLPDPEEAFFAPNLVITSIGGNASLCPDRVRLFARIENRGARGVAAGVPVAFYADDGGSRGALLGVARTTMPLFPGGGGMALIELDAPPLSADARLAFTAVVDDDGTGEGEHSECFEYDNAAAAVSFDCAGPI